MQIYMQHSELKEAISMSFAKFILYSANFWALNEKITKHIENII